MDDEEEEDEHVDEADDMSRVGPTDAVLDEAFVEASAADDDSVIGVELDESPLRTDMSVPEKDEDACEACAMLGT
jgi:hypothetical protein